MGGEERWERRWGDLMMGHPRVLRSAHSSGWSHTVTRSPWVSPTTTTLTFIATYYYHSTGVYIYLVECIDRYLVLVLLVVRSEFRLIRIN